MLVKDKVIMGTSGPGEVEALANRGKIIQTTL
jgi:hypothetical protein